MNNTENAQTENIVTGGIQIGPVIQGRDIETAIHLPAPVPTALAQLPGPVTGFAGRDEELASLAELLNPVGQTPAVLVSAVAGLAGVGKTSLAVQAAHTARQRGWYPGGMLFINLHGYDDLPVQPGHALDTLLRALGVPAEHIPPGAEERAALYRSALAQIREPLLLIADNASSEAQVQPLLPGVGSHRVLVTSRHTLAGLGARLVDVTVLDTDDAIAVLDVALRASRPTDDRITAGPNASRQLADMCAGLPLALQIIASILKADPTLSVIDLTQELAAESERLDRLEYDDGSGPPGLSVAAAFGLSYSKLTEIPARVFRLLSVIPGPDMSTVGAAVLTNLDVTNARRVLAELARAHLIEAAGGRWRMHDLLHLYARRLADAHADGDGRDQARERLLSYYLDMAEAAGEHLRALPGTALPTEFADREEAIAWLDTEQPTLIAAVMLAASVGHDQIAMRLPTYLAHYLDWRQRSDDRLATAEVSLAASRRLGDQVNERAALANFGDALKHAGRTEDAITILQEAVRAFQQAGDRHLEGIALSNLGAALREARRLDEAIAVCEEAMLLLRQACDWPSVGCALNNLAAAQLESGRIGEAVNAFQAELAICRVTGDRNGQIIALNNLGSALQQIGQFDKAIAACRKAVGLSQQARDRYSEGATQGTLARVLIEVGRIDDAEVACQEAVTVWRDIGDRDREATTLNTFSVLLQQAQQLNKAITASDAAIAIFREAGDRSKEGMALTSRGNALLEAGRLNDAIATCQQAVSLCAQAGDLRREGDALKILADALRMAGRLAEAIAAGRAAVARYRDIGDRHSQARANNNLGVTLQLDGQIDESIKTQQETAAAFCASGDRHSAALVEINLGIALREAGIYKKAIDAFHDAAQGYSDTADWHGEGTALANLGLAFREAQQIEEAISALEDALAIFQEIEDQNSERAVADTLRATRAAQSRDSPPGTYRAGD